LQQPRHNASGHARYTDHAAGDSTNACKATCHAATRNTSDAADYATCAGDTHASNARCAGRTRNATNTGDSAGAAGDAHDGRETGDLYRAACPRNPTLARS